MPPGTQALQSIRKYGQYHRPIARPILFWLNGASGLSPAGLRQPSSSDRRFKFSRSSRVMFALAGSNELQTAGGPLSVRINRFPRQTKYGVKSPWQL
jgi:hypothetical protein